LECNLTGVFSFWGFNMPAIAEVVPTPAPSPVLDVHGVAELLTCSERHVYRLVDAGRIPAPAKLGALNRWSRAIIETWIANGCPVPAKQ
jgi:excisionase family DNA binding protein